MVVQVPIVRIQIQICGHKHAEISDRERNRVGGVDGTMLRV